MLSNLNIARYRTSCKHEMHKGLWETYFVKIFLGLDWTLSPRHERSCFLAFRQGKKKQKLESTDKQTV